MYLYYCDRNYCPVLIYHHGKLGMIANPKTNALYVKGWIVLRENRRIPTPVRSLYRTEIYTTAGCTIGLRRVNTTDAKMAPIDSFISSLNLYSRGIFCYSIAYSLGTENGII